LRLFLSSPVGADVLIYAPTEVEKMRGEGNLLLAQIEKKKIRPA
jgi:hypothetical protein